RDFHVTGVQTCALPIFQVQFRIKVSKNQENVNGEVTTQGWKKDAEVFALRYGDDFLTDLQDILINRNANLVRQYSDELADALDRYERNIEQRLIDFMIFELDFPHLPQEL